MHKDMVREAGIHGRHCQDSRKGMDQACSRWQASALGHSWLRTVQSPIPPERPSQRRPPPRAMSDRCVRKPVQTMRGHHGSAAC
jgi:hypothetical protein